MTYWEIQIQLFVIGLLHWGIGYPSVSLVRCNVAVFIAASISHWWWFFWYFAWRLYHLHLFYRKNIINSIGQSESFNAFSFSNRDLILGCRASYQHLNFVKEIIGQPGRLNMCWSCGIKGLEIMFALWSSSVCRQVGLYYLRSCTLPCNMQLITV